jgi:hypothetical protein
MKKGQGAGEAWQKKGRARARANPFKKKHTLAAAARLTQKARADAADTPEKKSPGGGGGGELGRQNSGGGRRAALCKPHTASP